MRVRSIRRVLTILGGLTGLTLVPSLPFGRLLSVITLSWIRGMVSLKMVARVARVARVAGIARIACFAGIARIARIAWVASVAWIARTAWVARTARVSLVAGVCGVFWLSGSRSSRCSMPPLREALAFDAGASLLLCAGGFARWRFCSALARWCFCADCRGRARLCGFDPFFLRARLVGSSGSRSIAVTPGGQTPIT